MFITTLAYPNTNHFLHYTSNTIKETIEDAIKQVESELLDKELADKLKERFENKDLLYVSQGFSFELESEYDTIKVQIGPFNNVLVNPYKLQISISVYFQDRLDLIVNMFTLE